MPCRVGSVTNTGQMLRESVGLDGMHRQGATPRCSAPAPRHCGVETEGLSSSRTRRRIRRIWCMPGASAAGYKNTGLGGGAPDKAGAEVELYEDGTLEVRSSSAEMGQGLVAVMQMIVAEELAVAAETGARAGDGHRPDARRRTDDRLAPDLRHRQCLPPRGPGAAPGDLQRTWPRSTMSRRRQIRFENGQVRANGRSLSLAAGRRRR